MRRESARERALWTDHFGKIASASQNGTALQSASISAKTANSKNHRSRGRLRSGEMNKTEKAYCAHLDVRKHVGEIVWWGFEMFTFKIGPDTRYTPDFAVLLPDGILEMHDVKGTTTLKRKSGAKAKAPYSVDDAKVKIKVAAGLLPLVFKLVYKVDGNWIEEEV